MPTNKEQRADGWLSVTEVLDFFIPKGLLAWYLKTGAKEAKRLSTVALKIGSRVDELITQDIKDGKYKLSIKDSLEVKNCMEAWEAFKKDYSPKFSHVQREVRSDVDKVVGHIDLISSNHIIDVKCASSIKPNYWLQTAKYWEMAGADEYLGIAILRLDKNLGTYQFKTNIQAGIDIMECVLIFDGLIKAHRYYRPKGSEE